VVDGYTVFRRDRVGRRGGGVAIYGLIYSQDDRTFELMWIKLGALYHPPKPNYQTDNLLMYLEVTLEEICHDFPAATVILCGDFNQLSDDIVCEMTGLTSIVKQPTRGERILDRIYVSQQSYSVVRVITSVVRSDHSAVVAYSDQKQCTQIKTFTKRTYRWKTPAQHAVFLQYSAGMDFNFILLDTDIQSECDMFYTKAHQLLNQFYPQHTVTVTSCDPPYITGHIKAMLCRKNRLMRKGRIEKASALAQRIGKEITRRSKTQLSNIQSIDSRKIWECLRQLTGYYVLNWLRNC